METIPNWGRAIILGLVILLVAGGLFIFWIRRFWRCPDPKCREYAVEKKGGARVCQSCGKIISASCVAKGCGQRNIPLQRIEGSNLYFMCPGCHKVRALKERRKK